MSRTVLRYVLTYGGAVVAAELAAIPWLIAGRWVDPSATVLFLAATLAAAYFGGLGPGLLTVLLGYVATAYYFGSSTGNGSTETTRHALETTIWGLGAFAVSYYRLFETNRAQVRRSAGLRAYEDATERAGTAIATIDGEGRVMIWNPAAERLFGWTAAEIVGKELPTVPSEQHEADLFLTAFHQVLGGTQIEGKDVVQLRKDGTFIQTRFAGSPLRDAEETVTGMVCVWEDVTERRKLEASLRSSADEFKSIIEEMHVGVLVVGPRADVLACNPATLHLLGLSERQLLGTSMYGAAWAFMREDGTRYPAENYPILEVLTTGRPIDGATMGVFRPRTEDTVWLVVYAHAVLGDDGAIAYVLCTLTDITRYKDGRAGQPQPGSGFVQRPSS